MSLTIKPLYLGEIEVPKSILVSLNTEGKNIRSACIGWYIEGADQKIVVDTGPAGKEWGEKYHRKMKRGESDTLAAALEKIGVAKEEVRIVINTHLHWDHCYGNRELPNAKYIVQRDELKYAISPLPRDERMYEIDLPDPPFFKFFNRIEAVDGDCEIVPGVRVIKTPGHTPGSQGVCVETSRGIYVIAGDNFPLYENIGDGSPWPPGIFLNLRDFYQSAQRMFDIADYILPGHDPSVFDRIIYP